MTTDPETSRVNAAPDSKPPQTRRAGVRPVPRQRHNVGAAELTERVCLGLELDPKYVDVIVQRWQTLRGTKAKLDDDGRTFEEVAAERKEPA